MVAVQPALKVERAGIRGTYFALPESNPRAQDASENVASQSQNARSIGGSRFRLNPSDVYAIDPTVPSSVDRSLISGMLANRLPSTLTLREASVMLVRRGRAEENDQAVVADAIADKPVNLFGLEFSVDRQSYLQALAGIYGLELTAKPSHGLSIVLPNPKSLAGPGEFAAEMQRLIPCPLAQAAQRQATSSAETALYFPSIRRLIAVAQPLVPDSSAPAIPLGAAGPETRRLIALAMLSGEPLRELLGLTRFAPSDALAHPKTIQLTMARDLSGQTPILSMSFRHLLADGTYKDDGTARFHDHTARSNCEWFVSKPVGESFSIP